MVKTEKLNMQYGKIVNILAMDNITTVRCNVQQLYLIDPEIVTVDNVWNLLLIQFALTRVDAYADSVLLNKGEVLKIHPTAYSGIEVLNAVAKLITSKIGVKKEN